VAGQITQPNAICNVCRENIFRKVIMGRRPGIFISTFTSTSFDTWLDVAEGRQKDLGIAFF